ncbi:MAG: C25 family cysteine peptidase, partial [bacterium]|nr:C25 family cysteine peptidase [bacterium]
DWKTKKGVPAKVVTREFIYANYTGRDDAEMIRNFIIDANSTWGTIWFLLGGQCDFENGQEIIPRRDIFWMPMLGVHHYPDDDTVPSDLYFSDLDGTWNADGDNVWGEPTDGLDFYSDVFVGRAPVRNLEQVQTFVNKVLTYEKGIAAGYEKRVLLPATLLFHMPPFPDYWGDVVNNAIADITPVGWLDAKLYESQENLSVSTLRDSLNSGFGFTHIASHGREYGVWIVDDFFDLDDVDGLINGGKLPIINAISCMVGAVDYVPGGDCFAEHFVNNPNGGAIATIMNSRYGWGTADYMWLSEVIDTSLYHEVFFGNYPYKGHLGVANAVSRDNWVYMTGQSDPIEAGLWVWCISELNLIGDPELPMWTDEPKELVVGHDSVIQIGGTSLKVSVTSDGVAVDSAYVCVFKEGEVYCRDYTDASGNVMFNLPSSLASPGTMFVTATKHNFIPYEGVIRITVASGACMTYDHYEIDDSSCNNNGSVQPGETIKLTVTIHNVGVDTAHQIAAVLRTADSYITITDSTDSCGDVLPDSYKTGEFEFSVSTSITDYHNIQFELVMSDKNNTTWVAHFSIPIMTPILRFYYYLVDDDSLGDSHGNNNKFIQRGETIELPLNLRNLGNMSAYNVSATLSTYDTFVTIIDSIEEFGDISEFDTGFSFDAFAVKIKRSCPIHHPLEFYLKIVDEDNFTNDWLDTLWINPMQPGEVMSKFTSPAGISHGIASDGDKLWVTVAIPSLIYAVNPINGSVIKTIPAPSSNCMGLAWANEYLWVHGGVPHRQIYKIDTTGNLLQGFQSPAQTPYGIAFDGEHIFAGDLDKIFELDTDGNVISSFTIPIPSGTHPAGLGFEQSSQNLIIMMQFSSDSCIVYEIRRDGSIVQTHSFKAPTAEGSGVDCDLVTGDYWLICCPASYCNEICRVEGFYPWPPTPSADIRVRPDSLGVELQPNDTTSQLMRIKNVGRDTLTFSISELIDVTWLTETPTQGKLAPNDSIDIIVSYNAAGLAPDSTYNTAIEIVSNDPDEPAVSVPVELTVTVGTEEALQLPKVFAIHQNLPNPFNKATAIRYELPVRSKVSIKIYDITGSLVRILVDGIHRAGYYMVTWDGRDDVGKKLAAGVYFYQINAADFISIKKAILIR